MNTACHFALASAAKSDKRGMVHIIFDVDFRHGRFVRKPGEICCELFRQKALTSLKPVGESEWHYRSCPKCVRYASQYGVPLPHQPEIPDGTAMVKVLVSAPDSVDRPFVTRDPDAAGSYMKEEMFAITFPEQYLEQYLGHYKSQDWFAFTEKQWADLAEMGLVKCY